MPQKFSIPIKLRPNCFSHKISLHQTMFCTKSLHVHVEGAIQPHIELLLGTGKRHSLFFEGRVFTNTLFWKFHSGDQLCRRETRPKNLTGRLVG